eukprot:2606651-Rhodomonas_salina.1
MLPPSSSLTEQFPIPNSSRGKYPFRLDAAVTVNTSFKFVVEFDGSDHYPDGCTRTLGDPVAQMKRDRYVEQWALENSMSIFRVPYTCKTQKRSTAAINYILNAAAHDHLEKKAVVHYLDYENTYIRIDELAFSTEGVEFITASPSSLCPSVYTPLAAPQPTAAQGPPLPRARHCPGPATAPGPQLSVLKCPLPVRDTPHGSPRAVLKMSQTAEEREAEAREAAIYLHAYAVEQAMSEKLRKVMDRIIRQQNIQLPAVCSRYFPELALHAVQEALTANPDRQWEQMTTEITEPLFSEALRVIHAVAATRRRERAEMAQLGKRVVEGLKLSTTQQQETVAKQ